MADAHDPYAALRERDYRPLFAGGVRASGGTGTQAIAVEGERYQRTALALALGSVGLVRFLPVLVLSIPAGHAADRYSRRGILLIARAVTARASLGLAALS